MHKVIDQRAQAGAARELSDYSINRIGQQAANRIPRRSRGCDKRRWAERRRKGCDRRGRYRCAGRKTTDTLFTAGITMRFD